jgi:hypothetical protein
VKQNFQSENKFGGKNMGLRIASTIALVLALSACEETATLTTGAPEAVAAIAAPNQNLATAQLRPEDNCYWYSHVGPVETTLLPVRDVQGRPICIRPDA